MNKVTFPLPFPTTPFHPKGRLSPARGSLSRRPLQTPHTTSAQSQNSFLLTHNQIPDVTSPAPRVPHGERSLVQLISLKVRGLLPGYLQTTLLRTQVWPGAQLPSKDFWHSHHPASRAAEFLCPDALPNELRLFLPVPPLSADLQSQAQSALLIPP